MGLGVRSCAQYSKERQTEDDLARYKYFAWGQGLMSGLNAAVVHRKLHTDLAKLPVEAQVGLIDIYCDLRPQVTYAEAILDLFRVMRQDQQLPKWDALVGRP